MGNTIEATDPRLTIEGQPMTAAQIWEDMPCVLVGSIRGELAQFTAWARTRVPVGAILNCQDAAGGEYQAKVLSVSFQVDHEGFAAPLFVAVKKTKRGVWSRQFFRVWNGRIL